MTEIKTSDYAVSYDESSCTVFFRGALRLDGASGYAAIANLLNQIVESHPPRLTLDLSELKFLNSSGINMLSKFVIKVRQIPNTDLMVKGSQTIPWQGKSLKNLQRLMPSLQLVLTP